MLEVLKERVPLEFRVLYRQFLLRVVDLEALSMEADVPRLLGQFAGVLILISIFPSIGLLFAAQPSTPRAALVALGAHTAHGFFSGTMLIAGLIAVISWDNIFPDRRDVMVLGPLPVQPKTILLARAAACAMVLGVGVVALNFAVGVVLPLVLGGISGFPRMAAAWWTAAVGAALFVYASVLTLQGVLAWLLPRRWFLRASSVLQLAAFGYFLANYFLEPTMWSPAWANAVTRQGQLHGWPSFWFLAQFDQMSRLFAGPFVGLARRAWLGLAAALAGAAASMLLCYVRTMKKTVEEPDLTPGSGWRWMPRFGNSLRTAVVSFSVRSLLRSRQHRVVYAFFLAIAFAIAVSTLADVLAARALRPLTPVFAMNTLIMMCLAVVGLRSLFSLPVSLRANWVLQLTQLCPPQQYIAATRWAVLLMATIPVWLTAAALSLSCRPRHQVAEHLVVLLLAGSILTDASLIGVSKIPFACSYLPGKSSIQYMFWAFVALFVPLAMTFSNYELGILDHPLRYGILVAEMAAAALSLWILNRQRAKTAVLYYEESMPEVITTLGLSGMLPSPAEIDPADGRSQP